MIPFSKKISFLLLDEPKVSSIHKKYSYPAVNHLLAYNYSLALEKVLDWSKLDEEAKPASQIYHKMVSHTFKHVLHKYKKIKSSSQTHRIYAIRDFYTGEGGYIGYCDYPLTDDLNSLKREIGRLTSFRIDTYNELEDKHLEYLNIGSLSDFELYSYREFRRDFEVVNELWSDVVAFAKEKHDLENLKQITQAGKKKLN